MTAYEHPTSEWTPGDPCVSCGSLDTTYNDDRIAHCRDCGRYDDDEGAMRRSAASLLNVAQRELDNTPPKPTYENLFVLAAFMRQVVPLGQDLLDEIRRLREAGT